MNPMPELTPMLKQLRLSGIMDSIETRNRQAIAEKLSYSLEPVRKALFGRS